MGSAVGRMVSPQQPYMQDFYNAINQHAFNQQLGRGVSNQMYQPPRSDYDVYTATRRPNYMPYGPNQQFYQPIYQPSYSQFSPMGYGQAPFGGFYQPPMMGFGQRFGRQMFQQPQQNMFGPATDISDQGQAALRQMPQQQDMFRPAADIFGPAGERRSVLSERGFPGPMLSPQPMQSQYRPIPYMTQTQIDAKAAAQAAANPPADVGYMAKAGGKVHEEGIDSLLKK